MQIHTVKGTVYRAHGKKVRSMLDQQTNSGTKRWAVERVLK